MELLLFVCLRGLSLSFFFFCRGVYFPENYKDGTICKQLSHRTLEDSTLGSLWHDFLLSLSWLCLWERRQANYISVLFRLCSDPDSQCVHLHFMKEQKPSSREIQQEKGLPIALGWKVWNRAWARREGWEVSSPWVTLLREKGLFIPCPGLVGCLRAQIVLMNNFTGALTFFQSQTLQKS